MMVKRMNFIRNSLDQHNPREVTTKIREHATRKKEERMMELWKEDQA